MHAAIYLFVPYCALLISLLLPISTTTTAAATTTAIESAKSWSRYPCDYADTVNITEGLRLKDGSYSYEGILIPSNLIAEYDHKVIDGIEYSAPKHMRGCVCLLRPCISFCCPNDFVYDIEQQNCTRTKSTNKNLPNAQNTHVEVLFANGSVNVVNIHEKFVVRTEFGCRNKFVNKKEPTFWKWDLFENGTLLRDGRLWSTDEYCFTPLEHKRVWSLTPLNCERFQRGFRVWIYAICTILAVIINVFIFILLISINEARASHFGQLILGYLASIIIGYIALTYLALKNPMRLSHTACRNIGFLAYFCIMLSFSFLAICSFDFCHKFQLKSIRLWIRKCLFVLAVCFALCLRFLVGFAQDSGIARNLKPGIGEDYCWFDVRLWGILIYYYLPILLLLLFSIFYSIRAYFLILMLPTDAQNIGGSDVNVVKAHFYAFSAYLVGVSAVWLRELIVYVTARMREHFFIIDFWSGICILALAVTGFICFLFKNRYVQSWWHVNQSKTGKS